MTKILVDREALVQVLDALEDAARGQTHTYQPAVDKLRALLDAPSEPKDFCKHNYLVSPSYGGKLCSKCGKPESYK